MLMIDFEAVKSLSLARGCQVRRVGKLACEMTGELGTTAMCTAKDPEGISWDVLDVFRSCRDARTGTDRPHRLGKTTPPVGLDTMSHGLQEDVIADALAADGIWPYTSKRRSNALDALLAAEARGGFIPCADSNRKVKMAARAVIDAGLADHIIGPKGGQYLCIRWTSAAWQTLTGVEVDALATIAEKPAR